MIYSRRLRESARQMPCTAEIPGECSRDSTTVVLAHLRDSLIMAGKSDDICAAACCYHCHAALDSQPTHLSDEDYEFYARRAMLRTWRWWIEHGYIRLPADVEIR